MRTPKEIKQTVISKSLHRDVAITAFSYGGTYVDSAIRLAVREAVEEIESMPGENGTDLLRKGSIREHFRKAGYL